MHFDLHTHTTASDGALSPSELLERARLAGINVLAITDHDTLDGMAEAMAALDPFDSALQLISGIEFSSQWGKSGVHIVGLNFDSENETLKQFVRAQKTLRAERNDKILRRLEKQGFELIRERIAKKHQTHVEAESGNQDQLLADLGRPQIAQALVELGAAANTKKAFKRFLGAGGSAAVALNWPAIDEVVAVVRAAGGDAVLAHPLHYKLTATKLRALLTDFKRAGGAAIEVLSGGQNAEQTKRLAALASAFELKASLGSDFHNEQSPWQALGKLDTMPSRCEPVWSEWSLNRHTIDHGSALQPAGL